MKVPLENIRNLHERLDRGSVVPAGECPSCTCLCYLDDGRELKVVILDQAWEGEGEQGQLEIRVGASPHGVWISAAGHGDCCTDGDGGAPIGLELYEGKLILHVYADINEEDDTHLIDMSGALEAARKEEDSAPS